MLSRIVGHGLAPSEASGIEYTSFGKIAEQQLLSLEDRYAYLSVDQYVIMPNHIHVVLALERGGGSKPHRWELKRQKRISIFAKDVLK